MRSGLWLMVPSRYITELGSQKPLWLNMVCFFSMEGKNKKTHCHLVSVCEMWGSPALSTTLAASQFPSFSCLVGYYSLGIHDTSYFICLFLLGWPLGTSSAGQTLISSSSLKDGWRLCLLDPWFVAFSAEPWIWAVGGLHPGPCLVFPCWVGLLSPLSLTCLCCPFDLEKGPCNYLRWCLNIFHLFWSVAKKEKKYIYERDTSH